MSKFSVESVFKAIDKVSAPVRKMQARISKFTRTINRGFRAANRSINKFGKSLRGVASAGRAGLFRLSLAMGAVIGIGANFEQTLVNAAAKFPEGIRRGTKAFKELETVARRVGGTTEFTAAQAAKGLNFLAMAGFNAKQAMAALPAIVDLATAAQVDLATASDIATDSLGAFGLATKDPIQLGKNLARVNDVLALATVRTNTNMEQLFEGIVKGAPAFTAAGQSMESFTALMGVMANSGIKGGEAGTILRNTVLRLSNPVSQAARVMKQLGVNVADSDGNFRDILDIMQDFEKGLEGVGEVQRSAALSTVFGTRAVSGLSVQLKEGTTSIESFRKELQGAAGTSKEMASVMRDTLLGELKSLLSAAESVVLSLFKLKNQALEGSVEGLTKFVRSINTAINANKVLSKEIIDGVLRAAVGLIGVFGQLVILFVALKAVTLAWSAAVVAATVVTGVYNAAIGFNTALMGRQLAVANTSKAAMIAFAIGTKVATVATWLWNAALLANPIGLIIVGIGALIGVGVLLIKNWDSIVKAISGAVNKIKVLLKILFAPLLTVISGFSSIFGAAKALGLIGGGEAEEGGVAAGEGIPSLVTPQARVAKNIEERREKSTVDVNIRDETGRAEVEQKGPAAGAEIDLLFSGSFG